MYSLNANLAMASQALNADTGALSVINNNIANVNTPGYSRETVNLTSAQSTGGTAQASGVSFGGYTSVRDQVLQIAINQKSSNAASLSTQSAGWSSIESGFSDTSNDIGSAISSLFSGLSSLSTAPDDTGVRETAFSAAGNLVGAFHQAASTLDMAQSNANASISGTVQQVNDLASQIAQLNGQLASMQTSGQDGGTIEDQRDQLTTQLAQLVSITTIATNSSPTITTSNGSPLVIGDTAYPLQVSSSGGQTAQVIDSQGQNITSEITGGSLGGALTMRDQTIPGLSSQLDQLANQFATAFNAAQAQGYDQNGNAGSALFNVPTSASGSAAAITLAATDSSAIAISADGTAGSSGNLSNLLSVQTSALRSGQTPSNAYATLTQTIGVQSAGVTSNLNATTAALTQLTTQQSAESAVSIDEETTNLLRYQQAYSAAAQVVNTVNNLFSVLMNMTTVTS